MHLLIEVAQSFHQSRTYMGQHNNSPPPLYIACLPLKSSHPFPPFSCRQDHLPFNSSHPCPSSFFYCLYSLPPPPYSLPAFQPACLWTPLILFNHFLDGRPPLPSYSLPALHPSTPFIPFLEARPPPPPYSLPAFEPLPSFSTFFLPSRPPSLSYSLPAFKLLPSFFIFLTSIKVNNFLFLFCSVLGLPCNKCGGWKVVLSCRVMWYIFL